MKLKERAAAKAARRATRKTEVRVTKGPPIEADPPPTDFSDAPLETVVDPET